MSSKATRKFERLTGMSAIDSYGSEHLSPEELAIRNMKDRQRQHCIDESKGLLLGWHVWDEDKQDLIFVVNPDL